MPSSCGASASYRAAASAYASAAPVERRLEPVVAAAQSRRGVLGRRAVAGSGHGPSLDWSAVTPAMLTA